jgi:hypothetical protein
MAECRTLGQGVAVKMLQGLATTLKTIHIKDRYTVCIMYILARLECQLIPRLCKCCAT